MKDKPVILVVDDQPENIELLEAYLVPEGYGIVKAANGEEALGKISENQIDLVITDVVMPGMDGFEVTRRIRQDNAHQLLPIILVSVLREAEDRVKGIDAGCDDFISYPVDKMELLARVRSLLKVKAYNDLVSNYQKELESEVTRRTEELNQALENLQNDITARKRAEAALRESEEKYRLVVDSMADVITVMDLNLRFTYVSPSIIRLRGYTAEEVMAQNMEQIMTPESLQIITRVFEEELTLETSGTADPGRTRILELEEYRKDGSTVWLENHLSGLRDNDKKLIGIIALSRDIAARKRTETALQETEARYKALFDHSLDLVYITDFEGHFLDANVAALNRLGYTREEIRSLNFASLLSEDQLPLAFKTIQEIRETGFQIGLMEFRLQQKNGRDLYVETRGSTIISNGTPVAFQAIARDITERKRAEEELQRTLESLRKSFSTIIQVMVSTVEARDPYTAGHQARSADLSRAIAIEMGLSQDKIDGLRMAGSVHDIGKISIPAEILSKPTKLTEIEFSLIKEHSQKGYDILKGVESPWPLAQIVYQHHERMNGSGYPRNLKGNDLLMEARILAVADVVEAMASYRPYRPSLGLDAALEEIEKNRGTLYDNAVAEACLRLFREKGYRLE